MKMGGNGMPCCSLDLPPATASEASVSAPPQIVAPLHGFFPPQNSLQRAIAIGAPQPPGNPVFRLKEDLRV